MKVFAEIVLRSNQKTAFNSPQAACESLESNYSRFATLDFSSDRKQMSTIVREKGKTQNIVLLKGAVERVIDNCTGVVRPDGSVQPLSQAEKDKFKAEAKDQASQGLRVLGVAISHKGGNMSHINEKN